MRILKDCEKQELKNKLKNLTDKNNNGGINQERRKDWSSCIK